MGHQGMRRMRPRDVRTTSKRQPHFSLAAIIFLAGAAMVAGLWLLPGRSEPPVLRSRSPWVDCYLSFADKSPRIRRAFHAQGAWRPLVSGTRLHEGQEIDTREARRATIAIEDIGSLRLGPRSRVRLLGLRRSGDDVRLTVALDTGTLWIDRCDALSVVVRAGQATVKPLGEATEVRVAGDCLRVGVWRGQARFDDGRTGATRMVPRGQELLDRPGGDVRMTTLSPPRPDPWERWNLGTSSDDVREGAVKPESAFAHLAAGVVPSPPPTVRHASTRRVAGRRLVPAPSASTDHPLLVNLPPGVRAYAVAGVSGPGSASSAATPLAPSTSKTLPPIPASAAEPEARGHAAPSPARASEEVSLYEPPASLTRRKLPSLTFIVDKPLPEVNTSTPDGMKEAFDDVAAMMYQRFRLRLRHPVRIEFMDPDQWDDTSGAFESAGAGTERYLRLEPGATYHRFVTVSGMPRTSMRLLLVRAFGVFWWKENHESGAESAAHEGLGLGMWLEFKYLVDYGSNMARSYLLIGSRRNNPLAQFLHLEQDYGEYGVLYYSARGVPPPYQPDPDR